MTGYPQQGTYLPNGWNIGEIVTDFYLISSAAIQPGATYYLTVDLGDSAANSGHITVPITFAVVP